MKNYKGNKNARKDDSRWDIMNRILEYGNKWVNLNKHFRENWNLLFYRGEINKRNAFFILSQNCGEIQELETPDIPEDGIIGQSPKQKTGWKSLKESARFPSPVS